MPMMYMDDAIAATIKIKHLLNKLKFTQLYNCIVMSFTPTEILAEIKKTHL
jgi:hypothetical protein